MQIKKAGQPLFLRLLSFATKATNCLIQNTGKTLSLKLVGLARVDTTARGRYLGNAHESMYKETKQALKRIREHKVGKHHDCNACRSIKHTGEFLTI